MTQVTLDGMQITGLAPILEIAFLIVKMLLVDPATAESAWMINVTVNAVGEGDGIRQVPFSAAGPMP